MKANTNPILIIILMFIFISCQDSGSSIDSSNSNPEELKAELVDIEMQNPTDYLSDEDVTLEKLTKKIREEGFFRDAEYADDGAIINGKINNNATLAKYKDVVVKIQLYSQTNTVIAEHSYVIYKFFEPNSSTSFSIRLDELPSAYDSFSCEVTDASSVE
jgi:hypothetical protein